MSNTRGYSYENEESFKNLAIEDKRKIRRSVIDMRREFAKLRSLDPAAFDICAKEFETLGADGFASTKGKGRPEYTREVLAWILARYENRHSKEKTTAEAFYESESQSNYFTEFHVFKPNSASAVKSAIKTAKALQKSDAEFAEMVGIYLHVFIRGESYPPKK